ncbi:MAG: GEVED domain-containing protein [Bacteroidales bacterium]|nr:GEVED domain-containing protein [Bacteroidales bacterium]
MKKIYFFLFTIALGATLFVQNINAQVTVTNPGNTTPALSPTYPSLALAISALNTTTVISGPVIITLTGNETAPAGGYSITAIPTGTSITNNIIIQGSGSAITAYSPQATGSLSDAIFKLIGADFITIQNFTMQENAGNTVNTPATSNTMTEFGVALFYITTTNGAQNNVIQNNTISLNRTYLNTFGIYSNTRHSATVMTTTAEVTTAAGSNSFNKVFGNSINNVNYGIVFIGAGTTIAAIDNGNDIGGSSALTGNTITNWGGGSALSSYVSLTTSNYCIFVNQQINDNVSYNTIISASVSVLTAQLGGILKNYSVASPTSGTISSTITENTVSLTNSPTTSQMTGITSQGQATLVTATQNINNNKVINCSILGSPTSASFVGFLTTIAPGTLNINNNTVRGIASNATTGGFLGIQQQTSAVINTLNINNNFIGDAIAGAVTFTNVSNSGTVVGLSVTSTGAAATCALSISNNDIRGIVHNNQGTGSNTYIINGAPTLSQTITNNKFTNLSIKTTGSVTFISNSVTVPAGGTQTINNNAIITGFSKTVAGGTVTGITTGGSSTTVTSNWNNNIFSNISVTGATTVTIINNTDGGTVNHNIIGNTISNITGGSNTITGIISNFGGQNGAPGNLVSGNTITNISGAGAITGINIGSSGSPGMSTVTGNTISGLYTTGASAVIGITSSAPTNCSIIKNQICDLQSNNASGTVSGIVAASGLLHNVSNNRIGDLRTPIANAINPLNGINITGGTTVNAYYNTVYLNGSSTGALFGSSAINTSTTPALTLNNNIFVNTSTPVGATGYTVVYRRSSTSLGSYAAASDRNSFYAGLPGTNNLIHFDGTNSFQTLGDYKGMLIPATLAPRDANSISADPPFLSTACGNSNFLKISTVVATALESSGANIAGIIDDFENNVRQGNPGYPVQVNGGGSAPDIGADEFDGILLQDCAGPPAACTITGPAAVCSGTGTILSLSVPYYDLGITYQWVSGTTPGGPYPNFLGTFPTQATGALTVPTYYKCIISCIHSGYAYTTPQKSILINAIPSVSVNPASASYCIPGGSAVALMASGADTYSWSPAAGLNVTTGPNVNASPSVNTTYTVTGTAVNGCINTATSAITVGAYVTMNSVTATPSSVCSGGSTILLADASTPPVATYCQSTHTSGCLGDNMSLIVLNTLNSTVSACGLTGSTPPRYLYTTGGGANTTTLTPSGSPYSLTISFGTDPNQYFGAWIDYNQDGILSAGEFLGASANAGANGTTSVSFSVPGAALNGVTRLRIVGGNDSPVTATQACGASSSGYGETQDYDVTIAGATDPFTYFWSENPASGTLGNTTTNPTSASGITQNETYSVTVTSASGCTATGSVIVPIGAPVSCTSITNSIACNGVDFTVTANTTGGGGTFNYLWSDGEGGIYPDAQTVTANLAGGSHTFSVTVTDGCGTNCNMSQGITVGLLPGGTASGPATGVTYIVLPYAVTGYETGSTFEWQYSTTSCLTGFSTISGATTDEVSLTASTAGTFYIHCIVTGPNGCVTTTNCITTIVTVNGDNVCSAIPLSPGLNGPYTNVGATIEAGEPVPPGTGFTTQTGWGSGQTISNTVWFSFIAPPSGKVSIGNNSNFNLWDNQFALYSAEDCGNFTGFTLLAANDDSTVSTLPYKAWIAPICLTPGETYYLQVDGYSTGTNNSWGINLVAETNAPPAISGCPSNITIPVNASGCSADVSWTPPTALDPDDCLIPLSFTSNFTPGANFPLGTTTVTYTANDGVNPDVTCSFTVTVDNTATVNISGNVPFCADGSIILDAGTFSDYIWSTGETTQTITVNTAATFSVTVTDGYGCPASSSVTTTVNPLPNVSLIVGGPYMVCPGVGTSVTVESTVIGTSYQLRNDANNDPVGMASLGNGGTLSFPTGILNSTTTFNVLATILSTNCSAQLTGKAVVTVGSPVSTMPHLILCEGAETVDFPVTVTSFNNVGSLSLTFGYTPAELTNPTIISRNAAFEGYWDPFEVTTSPTGIFKVSGYGAMPGDGVTIADNDIMFTLRFNIVSGTPSSNVTFVENTQGTGLEYTGVAPDYTPFCDMPTQTYYNNGQFYFIPNGQVNDPADQVVCNGLLADDIIFTTNIMKNGYNYTYTWTNDNTSIGLAASGTGNIASFAAINTGTSPVVATIIVTPTVSYGGTSCEGPSQSFTITVNPTGQVNEQINIVKCIGDNIAVTFSTNNTGGTTTFAWTNNETGIGLGATGTGDIPGFPAANPGTMPLVATIVVTPAYTFGSVSCEGPAETFTITVNPTGQVDDTDNQVVCNGAATLPVTFTTVNSGGTTTFSWVNDLPSIGLAASGTGDIQSFNAINPGLAPVIATITVTPHFENGSANCYGSAETFTITVNPTGHVIQPQTQVLCTGTSTSVTFGTNNTDGYTTYFWTNSNTSIGLDSFGIGNIDPFIAVNTGTVPVIATINVTPTFTNQGVSCSGPTKSFTITVNPLGQVNQINDQTLCNGLNTTAILFTTTNTGGNTTYSWTNDQPGIGLSATGTGDIVSFAATNTGTAPIVATITVTPTFEKKAVSCTGLPMSFTITVNPTGQVDQPSDQVLCNGAPTSPVVFSTTNTVGATTYTWVNDVTSIGLDASGTGNIGAFPAINGTNMPVVATIVVTPHFEYGMVTCDGQPKSFTITVNPAGQVDQPVNQVVCNGTNTSVSFTTSNVGGMTTYSWINDTPGVGLSGTGTGDISFSAINIGNAPVVATIIVTPHFENEMVSCDGPAKTFTITVNPTGQVNGVSNQTLCNGSLTTAVNFTTNNTIGTTTYTWTNNATSIGLAASGTGNIPSFTATNTGAAPVLATVTVTPHFTYGSTTCTGNSQQFTFFVIPTAQVNQPQNLVVCNGASASVTFGTINTGGITTYQWTNTNPTIGLPGSGNGDISFTATNPGTSPVVATIVVTPFYGPDPLVLGIGSVGCSGPSKTFTITVNPTGQVNQPGNQVLSNGSMTSMVTFGTINTGGTTTYTWTNDAPSIGIGSIGTGNIAAFTAINTGNNPVVATIVVTPSFTNEMVSCSGPSKTFTITVNPKPLLVITNQTVCSPLRVDLTNPAVTAGSQLTFATLSYWQNAGATIPIADPTSVGNGTYYIKATINPGGWFDIKPVVVVVNPLPNIYGGIGSGNYCANVPSITAGITGSQIGVIYTLWVGVTLVSPTPIAGTGGPIYFAPIPPVAGQYWVYAENTTTHCFNRMFNCVIITITQPDPVSVTIAPSVNPSVADQNVTFTATPVNGGPSPSYQWKVNGFNVGGNSSTFTYKPVNGDAVTCVLTSNGTCVSGNPAISNTVVMTVTGYHNGNITVTGNVGSVQTNCYNALGTITVAGGGTTFIVNSGGSATLIAGQNIKYLPGTTIQNGGYMHGYISLTEHCGVKLPSIVNTVTGTDELPVISQKTGFKLYPNPTSGNFTLEQSSGPLQPIVRIEIYGMHGEKVFAGQFTHETKHEFSISELPTGLYFVKVIAGNEAETIKLIKIN